jgi:hypothetical protein
LFRAADQCYVAHVDIIISLQELFKRLPSRFDKEVKNRIGYMAARAQKLLVTVTV